MCVHVFVCVCERERERERERGGGGPLRQVRLMGTVPKGRYERDRERTAGSITSHTQHHILYNVCVCVYVRACVCLLYTPPLTKKFVNCHSTTGVEGGVEDTPLSGSRDIITSTLTSPSGLPGLSKSGPRVCIYTSPPLFLESVMLRYPTAVYSN